MSTYTEISRLIAARGRIRDKLTALGLATAQDKLDTLAGALDGVADCGAVEKTCARAKPIRFPPDTTMVQGAWWACRAAAATICSKSR